MFVIKVLRLYIDKLSRFFLVEYVRNENGIYFRMVFGGRRAAGPRSLPRLQQVNSARTEHDAKSRRPVRPRLRAAYQCCMY